MQITQRSDEEIAATPSPNSNPRKLQNHPSQANANSTHFNATPHAPMQIKSIYAPIQPKTECHEEKEEGSTISFQVFENGRKVRKNGEIKNRIRTAAGLMYLVYCDENKTTYTLNAKNEAISFKQKSEA